MNKKIGIALALVLAVGVIGGIAVSALAGDDTPGAIKPTHTVTVTSTATIKTEPDEAVITLGVRSDDPDSARALEATSQKMTAVLAALDKTGVAREDLQTLNLNLDRRTFDRGTPNEHQVFSATNSVQVTIRDLDAVGTVIDAAVQAGADSVHDIRFQLSNPNELRADALAQAVQGARTKADALAEAAGAHVTGVVTITEEGAGNEPTYRFNAYPAAFALGAVRDLSIVPPDTLESRVTVTVVWELG